METRVILTICSSLKNTPHNRGHEPGKCACARLYGGRPRLKWRWITAKTRYIHVTLHLNNIPNSPLNYFYSFASFFICVACNKSNNLHTFINSDWLLDFTLMRLWKRAKTFQTNSVKVQYLLCPSLNLYWACTDCTYIVLKSMHLVIMHQYNVMQTNCNYSHPNFITPLRFSLVFIWAFPSSGSFNTLIFLGCYI